MQANSGAGLAPENASPVALQAMAREATEARAMVESAQAFPRNESQAFLSLLATCKRPRFADGVAYSFPRGDGKVSGPSVDLAREAARCWGNLTYGIRIVSTEGEEVHIQGWAWDLQTNARVTVEDKFRRLIQRKVKGETIWVEPDERDLRELVNRRGAIAERNAILKVLPRDLIEDALGEAARTLEKDAEDALAGNREEAVKHAVVNFDALGVSPAMLEQHLGHPLKTVTADELAELRRIFKSLRDKHTKPSDHFDLGDARGSARKAEDLTEKVRGRGRAKKAAPEEEPAPEQPEEAEDALTFATCPACDGSGDGLEGDCQNCSGSGEVAA